MKNKTGFSNLKIITVAALLVFVFHAAPAAAIDIGLIGGAGNISFDTDGKEFLSDENNPQAFTPHLFPLISATVSGENGFVYYDGGFERDPILRNRLYANIGVDLSYFKMEAGPFIGLFNTDEEIFNPGFSAALGLQFPGIIFINVQASSSLGAALDTVGSYTQKTGGISAGFWVPNVICSLNLSTQTFARRMEINMLAEDSLDRYFFRADVFNKNVPFTIKVDIGYASLKRSYSSQNVTVTETSPGNFDAKIVTAKNTDEYRSIYLGLNAAYTVNPMIKLVLAGEMPVYSWSVPKMKNSDRGSFLYQASGGIVLSF